MYDNIGAMYVSVDYCCGDIFFPIDCHMIILKSDSPHEHLMMVEKAVHTFTVQLSKTIQLL